MPDLEWHAEHDLALTVPCAYCGAPAGQGCTVHERFGRDLALEHFPAHVCRITAARNASEESK